jgi:hypothetical protein
MILAPAYAEYLPAVGRVATKIIPHLEIESKYEAQIDFPMLMSLIWTIDLKAQHFSSLFDTFLPI